MMNGQSRIMLISPDLSLGGAERVMAILANNFAKLSRVEVHLVLLVQGKEHYEIIPEVKVHRPNFNYKNYTRPIAVLKTLIYLRRRISEIQPVSYLCFGGKYNSLAILAGLGLQSKSFVSDRSRPGISYGRLQDVLNRLLYTKAKGIIAQTTQAKEYYRKTIGHKNMKIIGNPIPDLYVSGSERKRVILNVGRFINSKNQEQLIDIFASLDAEDWQLWFIGDGELLNHCKEKVKKLSIVNKVKFLGNQHKMASFYSQSSIFAFTSVSEGFPNALAEAMSAGCACISFDCLAGPSDLIDENVNGNLIPVEDSQTYLVKLQELVNCEKRRKDFGEKARAKISTLSEREIAKTYLEFLIGKG